VQIVKWTVVISIVAFVVSIIAIYRIVQWRALATSQHSFAFLRTFNCQTRAKVDFSVMPFFAKQSFHVRGQRSTCAADRAGPPAYDHF
jgi:hypothetical protein